MTSFTVVTACRNAARYIDETVTSVLEQSIFTSGRSQLQYLVYDGASTDDTVARLRPYERHGVTVVSEPDGGLYSALAKALPQATGDYVAYLNAGDFLNPHGLGIAEDCFALPGVDWLTGLSVTYNERSQLTACSLPFRYLPELIACGAYGRRLPFIQQESTVWRRSLQATLDFAVLSRLRYAGDAYLWSRFATVASLHVVRGPHRRLPHPPRAAVGEPDGVSAGTALVLAADDRTRSPALCARAIVDGPAAAGERHGGRPLDARPLRPRAADVAQDAVPEPVARTCARGGAAAHGWRTRDR